MPREVREEEIKEKEKEKRVRELSRVDKVAIILYSMGEKTAERLMESISLQEDGSYIEIFRNLDIKEIMKEISTDILAKAMKTASEVIKKRIYKNMSERAGDMLREDIEDMGPTRISDIEKAQNEIVKVTMKLADEGKIFISGGREEDEYV